MCLTAQVSLAVNPPDAVHPLLVGACPYKVEHAGVALTLAVHLALHRCQGGLESACFARPASLGVAAPVLPVLICGADLPAVSSAEQVQGQMPSRLPGKAPQRHILAGRAIGKLEQLK